MIRAIVWKDRGLPDCAFIFLVFWTHLSFCLSFPCLFCRTETCCLSAFANEVCVPHSSHVFFWVWGMNDLSKRYDINWKIKLITLAYAHIHQHMYAHTHIHTCSVWDEVHRTGRWVKKTCICQMEKEQKACSYVILNNPSLCLISSCRCKEAV